jgi:hypothetical protein
MRNAYTYRAENPRHTPMQSPVFASLEDALAWASVAADKTRYHTDVYCTYKSLPDEEYGDTVLDVQTNRIGVVLHGSKELVRNDDARFPAW